MPKIKKNNVDILDRVIRDYKKAEVTQESTEQLLTRSHPKDVEVAPKGTFYRLEQIAKIMNEVATKDPTGKIAAKEVEATEEEAKKVIAKKVDDMGQMIEDFAKTLEEITGEPVEFIDPENLKEDKKDKKDDEDDEDEEDEDDKEPEAAPDDDGLIIVEDGDELDQFSDEDWMADSSTVIDEEWADDSAEWFENASVSDEDAGSNASYNLNVSKEFEDPEKADEFIQDLKDKLKNIKEELGFSEHRQLAAQIDSFAAFMNNEVKKVSDSSKLSNIDFKLKRASNTDEFANKIIKTADSTYDLLRIATDSLVHRRMKAATKKLLGKLAARHNTIQKAYFKKARKVIASSSEKSLPGDSIKRLVAAHKNVAELIGKNSQLRGKIAEYICYYVSDNTIKNNLIDKVYTS